MKKRFLFLYVTTIAVVMLVATTSIYLEYKSSIDNAKASVKRMLDARTSIIKSIYNQSQNDTLTKLIVESSSLLENDHDKVKFDFAIAFIKEDSISFLRGLKKTNLNKAISIPIHSEHAVLMQLALKGGNGEVWAKDYAGDEVYAAYQYLPELKWGVVSKVDVGDIRAIYIKFSIIILVISIVLVLLSSYILSRYTSKIDKEILENEEMYRRVFKNANDGIFLSDKAGRYYDVNETACKMLGYSKNELTQLSVTELISKSSQKIESLHYNEVLSGKNIITRRELNCKDGSVLLVELSAGVLPDGNVMAIVRDITENIKYELKLKTQKEEIQSQNEEIHQQNDEYRQINEEYKQINEELTTAKEKVEESEKLLRESQEIARLGSYTLDIKTGLWKSSEILDKIFGIDESYERSVEGWGNLIHPDDKEMMLSYFSNEVIGNKKTFDKDYRIVNNSTGNIHWVHGLGNLDIDSDGNILRMYGTIIDITERKQREEEILTIQKLLNATGRMASVGGWEIDLEKQTLTWTEEVFRIHETDDNFKPTIEGAINFYAPESIPVITEAVNKAIEKGEGFDLQLQIITAKGVRKWVHALGNPMLKDGKVIKVTGAFRDIHFIKLAEGELKQSEEKFRNTFDQSPVGAAMVGINKVFLNCNTAFCKFLGYEISELLGKTISDITYHEDIEKGMKEMKLLVEGKLQTFTVQKRYKRKNGDIVWGEISTSLLRDSDNKPLFFLPIIQDIHLKKISEERIIKSEGMFKSLITHLEAGVVVHSSDTKITAANLRASELLGLSEEQMLGKLAIDPRWKFINENHVPLTLEEYPVNKVISSKIAFKDFILGVCIPDKENIVWLTVNGFPVFNEGNQISEIIISFIDITDRILFESKLKEKNEEIETQNEEYKQINEEYKQINDELFISRQKAEESDRLKSAFLANMSHEIRTPMNGIIGFADLLNNPELTEKKRKEFTKIIIERSHQLLSIVSDILDISKIEAGLVKVQNETISINELLSELWSFYCNNEKLKNIKLENKPGLDGFDKFISVDKTKLTQIINNLLNNSIKFTQNGKIIFGYQVKGEFLEFFVEDTGIGIPDNYKDKMFERFRQVEEQMTKNFGGTGLGLAISKELVEMMGGKIWLESHEGIGTKVFFTIPYIPITPETELSDKEHKTYNDKNFSGKSVLIVDDDSVNLLYLKELLTTCNLIVFEAVNGVEAVEQFRNNREIAMVFIDLKMPLMNGIEASKLIKSLDPKIKIIAQTAYAMSSEKEDALNEGLDDYISKPLNKELVIELVRKYL